jgi:hypothetical protein
LGSRFGAYSQLVPECLDEWVEESNSVRVVDSFVHALDLADLGFEGIEPAATGRPAYHPSVLLKLFGAKGFVSVAIARRWIGRHVFQQMDEQITEWSVTIDED